MSERDGDAAVIAEAVWTRLGAQDWDGVRELLHEDYVQEWPQSGERIEGPDDAIAVNKNFPGGLPAMRFRRTRATGDLVVLEVELTYSDGSVYQGVSVVEIRDGKVLRETDYFAQPFDAPQWRAQWVTRIPR
jgi:ketosteroid isomerase-like protein